MSNATALTAKQTETLVACYRERCWGTNPDWPQASRPCRLTGALKGKATQIRALERMGLVTTEETGHGMGACGVSLIVTMTERGVDLARATLGPECQARAAQWAAKRARLDAMARHA